MLAWPIPTALSSELEIVWVLVEMELVIITGFESIARTSVIDVAPVADIVTVAVGEIEAVLE
jgi:hypothetical protein